MKQNLRDSWKQYIDPKKIPLCQVCGTKNSNIFFSLKGYSIYKCPECGLCFTGFSGSASEAMKDLYDRQFFEGADSACDALSYWSYKERRKAVIRNTKTRLQFAEKMAKKGTFLELGCAMGFGLEAAKDLGWEPEGFDLSEWAVKNVKEKLGFNAESDSLKKMAGRNASRFNLIAGFDILTHMTTPADDLKHIHSLLAPGGILMLEEGLTDSHAGKLLGKKWFHYAVPFHVHYFNRRSLKRILTNAGFEVLEESYLKRVESLRESIALATGLLLPSSMKTIGEKFCRILPRTLVGYNSFSNLSILARKVEAIDS